MLCKILKILNIYCEYIVLSRILLFSYFELKCIFLIFECNK